MRYGFLALLAFALGACSARDSSATVTITGRVVEVKRDSTMDTTLTPIPGVQVTATMVNEPANPGEIVPSFPPVVTKTNTGGRFSMDLPLSGVVDDPANPTRIIPAVGLPVRLEFREVRLSGVSCDTTVSPHILWKTYSELSANRIFQLPDAGTLDIGDVHLEEFTEVTQFAYGTPGGC